MADRIPPPAAATPDTHCTAEQYDALYRRSLDDPDGFWAEQARRIDWVKAPERIADWSFDPVEIKWFEDGVLNLCHNCVDRHLAARSADIAIVWEGDEPGVTRTLTYGELHAEVVADGEQPEGAGRRQGRPRHPLYADDPRGGGGDARLRADRRGPLRRLRRLLARGAARPDRGLRQPLRRHRRRRQARRQAGALEGQCRRGARPGGGSRRRDRRPPSRQRHRDAGRPRPLVRRARRRPSPTTARASRWTPRTRSSSSTRRARPASPRACSTRPAAMRCGPRPPSIMCSTTGPARSSGAPPTSAGSPATATSSTARSPTARPA